MAEITFWKEDKAYDAESVTIHSKQLWRASEDTDEGDEPGTSDKWEYIADWNTGSLYELLITIVSNDDGAAQQLDEHINALITSGYPGKAEFTIRIEPDKDGNLKTSVDQRTRIQIPQDRRVFSKHRVIAVDDDGRLHALTDYPPGPHHPEDVDRDQF